MMAKAKTQQLVADPRPNICALGLPGTLDRHFTEPAHGMGTTGKTYAKVHVTPGWDRIEVWDVDAQAIVNDVLEVDACRGCYFRYERDRAGHIIVNGLKPLTVCIVNRRLLLNWKEDA